MFDKLTGVVMKAKSLVALLAVCVSTVAVPSFAGGYGTASSSDYSVAHAHVSHHAHAVRTRTAKPGQTGVGDRSQDGVGGDEFTRSQSGHRAPSDTLDPMYHGG